MIAIIVITHGQFGQELLRTAQDIVGRQEGVTSLSVTPDMGPESLGQALGAMVDQLNADGYLIMVDMLGGTPCNTALLKTRNVPSEIITGVNLYMLISSFTHREKLELHELASKAAEDGKRAIVLAKELLKRSMA